MGKHAKKRPAKTKRPKTKFGLPDLDHSKAAVLESLRSPEICRSNGNDEAHDPLPVVRNR
jgi:hypothetical protein